MIKNNLVSEKEAKKLAQKLFGHSEIERPPTGRNNWVYMDKNAVLSIPKDKNKIHYAIRVNAIKLFEKNNIPTTTIIDYNNFEGIEYLMTERLKSTNMNLEKFNNSEQSYIHQQTGEMLKKIHQITVEDYGRLQPGMKGNHNDWNDFLDSFFSVSINRLKKSEVVWQEFGERILEKYEQHKPPSSTQIPASFLHGDYHLGNLLFEGKNIRAVIDLDIVMAGDTSWDIAHYQRTFNLNREEGMTAFRKGYGQSNAEHERFNAMVIWTRKIASQGLYRPEALKETLPEMRKILSWKD